MTNTANKQPGQLRRFGLAGAIIVAACLATGATFLGYGVDANLPWPVTSNTTIAAKHCGGTVQAGTGSTGFFTVTVPGVSGFPSNCVVNITNGDTTTLRGKGIAGLSGSGCSTQNILWPGQTCKIGIVNGAWAVLSRPGRWRPASNTTLQFYSDFTNGSDIAGATDGLAAGTSAFKTANRCLYDAVDQIDFNVTSQTKAVCNMAAATTDATGIHLPFHDATGAQGTAALQLVGASLSITGAISNGGLCEITVPSTATYSTNEIVSVYNVSGATGCNGTWQVTITDGTHLTLQNTTFGGTYTSGGTVTNGSILNPTGDSALQCYYSTVIEFANVFFEGNGFSAFANCYVQMQSGNIFGGSPTGNLVLAQSGAQIHFVFDIGITSGASNSAFQANFQALIVADNNFNVNFLPGVNPTFTQFVLANTQGQVNFQSVTINLNGDAVTGTRCVASSGGLILSGSGNANTYFPGNSSCTQSGGGNIDGVVTPPNPTASTLGGIESIATLAHNWIASIDTSGIPHQSQPATSDLSDVTTPTAWTAVDGSGAGLSLTTSDTFYTKIGNVCTVSFAITYPTTANTNTAQISGIPTACVAKNGTLSWVAGAMALDGGAGIGVVYAALQKNGQSIFFFNSGAQQTNANKSNVTVRGTITYITN